ncbi:MAG: FAD:protein FMN transferase [Bifidobacteriaceae bacterium]|jgi:thiamine biosynthesis lipoprotein|nr:FAD:protein FMN transferase [Bifidobacteriaceae bacterium]
MTRPDDTVGADALGSGAHEDVNSGVGSVRFARGGVRIEVEAMGTVVRVRAYAIAQALAATLAARTKALLAELERVLSRFTSHSDVARIRAAHGGWTRVHEHTGSVLEAAQRMRRTTDGAFDVCLGAGEIDVDNQGRWRSTPDAPLDLGGIAKGYAADRIRDLYSQAGVGGALVDIGSSSIAAHGEPEGGGPWRVGLRAPGHGPVDVFGTVDLSGGALSTSGDYVRREEAWGEGRHRRQMILDPRTGSQARSSVLSATVLGADGMTAEALSTAAVVLGPEGLVEVLARERGFDAILATEAGILATSGVGAAFTPRRPLAGAQASPQ